MSLHLVISSVLMFQCLSTKASPSMISGESQVELTIALMNHFRPCGLYLFEEQNGGQTAASDLISIQKRLSNFGISAAVILIPSVPRCGHIAPLYVMLSAGPQVQQYLLQLSRNSEICFTKWLILLDSKISPKIYFRNMSVLLNCEMLVAQHHGETIILTDVYRIGPEEPLVFHYYGNWSYAHGLQKHPETILSSRSDLHGVSISVTYINQDLMFTLTESNETASPEIDGYFGLIWTTLQKKLNFTTEYVPSIDGYYGSFLANGSFNGIVNMIQDGLVHGACCNIMMNSKRAEVVDFVAPLFEESVVMATIPTLITLFSYMALYMHLSNRESMYRADRKYFTYEVIIRLDGLQGPPSWTCVFIKEPDSIPMRWTDFFRPFGVKLKCLVVAVYLLLSFTLWFTQALDRWKKRNWRMNEAMFSVFSTFCMQSHDLEEIRGPCRIIFFTSYVTALVLSAGYSASLISILASREISLPFRDFQGLHEDGSYKVGVLKNSAQFDNIKFMTELAIRKVYSQLMAPYADSMPLNDEEAFQRVCSEKFAYLSEFLETVGTKLPCRVTAVPQASIPVTLSMAIAKNSPYLRLFNYYIQRMRMSGILKKLKLQILNAQPPEAPNPIRRLDLVQVAPLFSILLLGFVVSLNILFLERLTYKKPLYVSRRKEVYRKDVEGLDQ